MMQGLLGIEKRQFGSAAITLLLLLGSFLVCILAAPTSSYAAQPTATIKVNAPAGGYTVAIGQTLTVDVDIDIQEAKDDAAQDTSSESQVDETQTETPETSSYVLRVQYVKSGLQQLGDFDIKQVQSSGVVNLDFTNWPWVGNTVLYFTIVSVANSSSESNLAECFTSLDVLPASFTMSFDAAGGVCDGQPRQVTYGLPYGELPQATREGYVFQGWYAPSNMVAAVNSESLVAEKREFALVAHWAPEEYTLYFDTDGGTVTTSSMAIYYEQPLGVLPVPEREGYGFQGWYTEPEGKGDLVTASSAVSNRGDMTVYAYWKPGSFNLHLELNGGTAEQSSIPVVYGEAIGTLPKPVRSGYTFTGWHISQDLSDAALTEGYVIALNPGSSIYASWKANSYIVAYDAMGGSLDARPVQHLFGTMYGQLPTPARTGYEFLGWTTAANDEETLVTSSSPVATPNDHMLYALWEPVAYQIALDADPGSCVANSITVKYGDSFGQLPVPQREGYEFKGWFTEEGGNGEEYSLHSTASEKTPSVLYAAWTPCEYLVALDANGGTSSAKYIAADVENKYAALDEVTVSRDGGYLFAGWFTQAEGGDEVTSNSDLVCLKDHELYAHWSCTSLESATVGSVAEYTYDGAAKTPRPEVRMGNALLVENVDYKLSYSNNINAGSAKIIVEGMGAYAGKVEKTFTIAAANIMDTESNDAFKMKLSSDKFTYDKKAHKPTVMLVYGGVKLVQGVDYEVRYSSGCKKIGHYNVKAVGIGNYQGYAMKGFVINPAAVKFTSVKCTGTTPDHKTSNYRIKWNKAKGADGYEFVRSVASPYKALSSSNSTLFSEKVLNTNILWNVGSKYKIRIRAYKKVKGTYYYSDWSKTVKVKAKRY